MNDPRMIWIGMSRKRLSEEQVLDLQPTLRLKYGNGGQN
jgi:hypothetical protein